MELNDNALVSTQFVIDQLGLQYGEPQMQERLIMLINWISDYAQMLAGREIHFAQRTIVLDGTGTSRIYLPVSPVESITSVTIDANRKFDIDPMSPEYYRCDASGVLELLWPYAVWERGRSNIQVVFSAGYKQETMPFDIRKACLESIQAQWSTMNDYAFGAASKTMSDGTNIQYQFDLTLDAKRVFSSLRGWL